MDEAFYKPNPISLYQSSPSIIAPVLYALNQTPNPAAPPKITDGHRTRSPSAPVSTSAIKKMIATAIPSTPQPVTTFSRLEMKRVRLKCWTLSRWLVRRVSSLNSFCGMRRPGGVNRLCGTRRAYRVLNSSSVCIPFRRLQGRQATWRLLSSLDPPLTTGIRCSICKLVAVLR